MLRELIRRVSSFSLFKPRVLVCVPGGISGVEERAIVDAVIEGGGRRVYLVESAVATAVGAGLDVNRADGTYRTVQTSDCDICSICQTLACLNCLCSSFCR